MNSRYTSLISPLLIFAVGFSVYCNSFYTSFHFDDIRNIVDNYSIRNIYHIQDIWRVLPRRFLLYLTLALNYHFNGLSVFGYHLFNLTIHLITAWCVWLLVGLTLSTPVMRKEKIAAKAYLISLLSALVFVSHPLQTEAVTYIVQRTASLAALFYLLALIFYIKFRTCQQELSHSSRALFYYLGCLFFIVLAMYSKETAVTLPFMVLLYEFCFFKTKKRFDWKFLIPIFFTILIIPLTMLLTEAGPERVLQLRNEPGISPIHYLLTQLRVIVTYIRLALLPLHQNLDYDYPIFKSIVDLPVLASAVFLGTIIYSAKRLFPKYRLISFSIFWFFLTLLPESSLLPIKDVIFEHRMYLPMIGFSIFLVSGCYYLIGNKSTVLMAVFLFFVIFCFSVLTYQRNAVWKNELILMNDVVSKSPHKARPHYNRGCEYLKLNELKAALADMNQAIDLDPKYVDAYVNRGEVFAKEGDVPRAMLDFNKAIELNPVDPKAFYNRGLGFAKEGDLLHAIYDFDRAIELNPLYADAYYNRGLEFAKQNEFSHAFLDFTKAIELNPLQADAYNDRGLVSYKQGEFSKAVSDYEKAIELNPSNSQFYINRGLLLMKQGSPNQAISDYNKAIEVNSNDANAYFLRGNAFKKLGKVDQALSDYNKAISLNLDYAEAYYNRANTFYDLGNMSQAVSDYSKVINLTRDIPQAYKNRAIVYLQLKKYEPAWADVHKAQELGVVVDPGVIEALKGRK